MQSANRATRPRSSIQKAVCAESAPKGDDSAVQSLAWLLGKDEYDPAGPQKEAAMFYGLFLRGHSLEALRRDIDVPREVVEKWLKTERFDPGFRDSLRRLYAYRKQVLAIFDELVLNERGRPRLQ